MNVVTADISSYQAVVDDRYPRDWLIFRACHGDYLDANAARNLAWCVKARESGRLLNFSVYVVYAPGETTMILRILDRLGVPDDCVIEIDVETWRGQSYEISGDHSAELNILASKLRVRQQGRSDLVCRYGNRGDMVEVWPSAPKWIGWVVASYGGSKPTDVPNLAGWQYTDGQPQYAVTGLPSTSSPFGRCDHDVLYDPPEYNMPTADEIAKAIARYVTGPDGATLAENVRYLRAKIDATTKTLAAVQADLDQVKAAQVAGTLHLEGDVTVTPK